MRSSTTNTHIVICAQASGENILALKQRCKQVPTLVINILRRVAETKKTGKTFLKDSKNTFKIFPAGFNYDLRKEVKVLFKFYLWICPIILAWRIANQIKLMLNHCSYRMICPVARIWKSAGDRTESAVEPAIRSWEPAFISAEDRPSTRFLLETGLSATHPSWGKISYLGF